MIIFTTACVIPCVAVWQEKSLTTCVETAVKVLLVTLVFIDNNILEITRNPLAIYNTER